MACIDNGQVTCWDGSCANTYSDCPSLESTYTDDEGQEVVGAYTPAEYENPFDDTTQIEFIYEQMGGQDYFQMSMQDFANTYYEDFLEYDPTQAENIASQLGILDASADLRDEKFDIDLEELELQDDAAVNTLGNERILTGNNLYNTLLQVEGVRRAGRGIRSGQTGKRISKAFGLEEGNFASKEKLTELKREGIILDRKALDAAYDISVLDYESRELGLLNDINRIEQNFEDNLWDQIQAELALGDDGKFKGEDSIITGCTNPSATNYNPSAVSDDGTCIEDLTDDTDDTDNEDISEYGAGWVNAHACNAVSGYMHNGYCYSEDSSLPLNEADWDVYQNLITGYNNCNEYFDWNTGACGDSTENNSDNPCPAGQSPIYDSSGVWTNACEYDD